MLERGKFSHRPRNEPRFFSGEHPWIQIGEIEASDKFIRTYTETLNDDGLAISRKFPKGTLLVSIAATIGAVGILDFDCCVPDSIVAITPDTSLDSEYTYHYLGYVRSHLERVAPQSAQKNINLRILTELPVPAPAPAEQRRPVASCSVNVPADKLSSRRRSSFRFLSKHAASGKVARHMASEKTKSLLAKAKSLGFSDRQIAQLVGATEDEVRALRKKLGLVPSYRLVDTCAAEFEAYTPYYYSTYDRDDDEVRKTKKKKVMILGGGPNRIGQGIEFDYCCVHAAFALKELGFETIMVNSNPETVSTDYDTSDKLYFEPLTLEDVLHIYEREGCWGAIAQFGGQTPLNLALGLQKNGVNIIGTTPQSIEIAEDRKLFAAMLDKLQIPQPPNGLATNEEEALAASKKLGYPVLVRPSFVLGGRAMQIVYSDEELRYYMRHAVEASPERPVLVDKFLEEAIEVDVDCIADIGIGGDTVVIGGFLEHIEFAGCHSGDAAMVLPPHSLAKGPIETMRRYTHEMARELQVAGLMNVQFAVKGKDVWVLEVNPRASRTVPFVSKAIGRPLAKLAAKVMTGKKLTELGLTEEIWPKYFSVKESVFPFSKFPGQDILLGPEMRSTGEVMGIGRDWGMAYAKSQMAAQPPLPQSGKVFISVRDSDKPHAAKIAKELADLGFTICATDGTADVLEKEGLQVQRLFKVQEGRPNVLDLIKNGEVQLIINTPAGKTPRVDEVKIRTAAVLNRISIMTTLASGKAAALGVKTLRERGLKVHSLQEFHARGR